MTDIMPRCDAANTEAAELRHNAVSLQEQAATLRMLLAERRAQAVQAREDAARTRAVRSPRSARCT